MHSAWRCWPPSPAPSGAQGMVLGQAQDIAAETAAAPLTLEQITELQGNKTGRLIEWPAEAGRDPRPRRPGAAAHLCPRHRSGVPDRR